jgi:hypothetical protein
MREQRKAVLQTQAVRENFVDKTALASASLFWGGGLRALVAAVVVVGVGVGGGGGGGGGVLPVPACSTSMPRRERVGNRRRAGDKQRENHGLWGRALGRPVRDIKTHASCASMGTTQRTKSSGFLALPAGGPETSPAALAAVPAANLGPGTRPEPAPTTHGGYGRKTTGGWPPPRRRPPGGAALRPRACEGCWVWCTGARDQIHRRRNTTGPRRFGPPRGRTELNPTPSVGCNQDVKST